MDGRQYLIIFITLVLAAAFLYIWKRRDEGKANRLSPPDQR